MCWKLKHSLVSVPRLKCNFVQEPVFLVLRALCKFGYQLAAKTNLLYLNYMSGSKYYVLSSSLETTIQVQTHNSRCQEQLFLEPSKTKYLPFSPWWPSINGKFISLHFFDAVDGPDAMAVSVKGFLGPWTFQKTQ